MKRILTSILMLSLLAGAAFGLTYDADYYAQRKSWLGAQNNSIDPLWLHMNEVGSILHEKHGTIYYVDNNSGDDDDDGLSWDKAFLTITYALRASHVNIATSPNYADRNTIFVRGDDFDEDLTDLAQKTDVWGVGSDDGNKGPRLLGNHVIDAVATGYNYMGCRFINMTFVNQTAADIFVVPTGHHGLEWIGCRFESNSSVLAPSAIDITQCSDTRIVGCEFISSVNPMWASGAIDFGAGLCQNTDILNNFIDAAIGITIDSSATGLSSRIEGNTIHTSTLTIDDNSDVFWIANNTLISDAAYGGSSYDFAVTQSIGNVLTASDGTYYIPTDATLDTVLADTAELEPLREGCAIKVLSGITNGLQDLFVVSGGPIQITEIIGIVTTTAIEAKGCLINYSMDPTSPAGDTVFGTDGTALEINGDTVGALYTWDGVIANDLTATDNGVALGVPGPTLIVPVGSIELAAVVATSATGQINFYIRYKPLAPGASVAAAP